AGGALRRRAAARRGGAGAGAPAAPGARGRADRVAGRGGGGAAGGAVARAARAGGDGGGGGDARGAAGGAPREGARASGREAAALRPLANLQIFAGVALRVPGGVAGHVGCAECGAALVEEGLGLRLLGQVVPAVEVTALGAVVVGVLGVG